MPQDQGTGERGDRFGRLMAPRIADAIGASMTGPRSNEAVYRNVPIVIKCAGPGNERVGVTNAMLERIEMVIGAFQTSEFEFEVHEIAVEAFRECMAPTRSKGASAGKVSIVSREDFRRRGRFLQTVHTGPTSEIDPVTYFRVVHDRHPWRKVSTHKSLDSALHGELGAHHLLLRRGRVAERWEDYGDVKCVFVWKSGEEAGLALRLQPGTSEKIEQARIPTRILARFEAARECSDEDIENCFRSGAPAAE